MKSCFRTALTCALFAVAGWAQAPVIGGLANNYSYVPAGLPNYGIAQGSIFDIFATNLVTSSSSLQDPSKAALPTTLDGVTITVTVNGTVTHPYMYFIVHGSPDEVAAVLPSSTPTGTGTITVSNANGTSAAYPIVVVQSAFGILALNGYGSGMGAIQDYNNNYNLLGLSGSAKPNDILVLWGTGLGPVTADESKLQQQQDMGTNYPIEVDIGGVSAAVSYHGRSVFPGLDEVYITVPQGISGCNNSVVVRHKNTNVVSNVVTAPIGPNGGACSDTAIGITSTALQRCATSGCAIGNISVGKSTTTTQSTTISGITIAGQTTTSDNISAAFYRYTPAQISGGIYGPSAVSIGSCSVYQFSYSGQNPPSIPTGLVATPLNAGIITATTPIASGPMNYSNGGYSISSTSNLLVPATGGTFSFTNANGGPDVGQFAGATITLSSPLTWSNPPNTVTLSQGLTVNWTGGNPGTYVTISGSSFVSVGSSGSSFVGANFWCNAPQSALTFTVPSTVLLALPPSGSITSGGITIALPGNLSVSNAANPVAFTAQGLDFASVNASISNGRQVTYQ